MRDLDDLLDGDEPVSKGDLLDVMFHVASCRDCQLALMALELAWLVERER